jgi:RES domain-containing protein
MASTPDPPFLNINRRFWRVLTPRWAHQPLSGEGAGRNGGRWNPKGTPALYLSAELTTAVAEYEQDIGIRPGTFCAYDVTVDRALDLTSVDVLKLLGVEPAARYAPWKAIHLAQRRVPPGWRIAETLISLGAAGVLVPSIQMAGGTNLVLWHWNDAPGRTVVALDPQTDLPRDGSSWQ